jgi:hypothetical protein
MQDVTTKLAPVDTAVSAIEAWSTRAPREASMPISAAPMGRTDRRLRKLALPNGRPEPGGLQTADWHHRRVWAVMPHHQELLNRALKGPSGVMPNAPVVKLNFMSCLFNRSKTMNIFYIIGVVVVILVVASFLGLHV